MAFESIPVELKTARTSHARSKLRKRLLVLRNGIAAHLPPGQVLPFPRRLSVTREQLLAEIEPVIAAFSAVDRLVIQLKERRLEVEELLAPLADMLVAMDASLRLLLGPTHPKLQHFGLKPRRTRRPLTSTEKVAVHAQSLETRKIRRTMGKNQKTAFKSGPMTVTVKPKK